MTLILQLFYAVVLLAIIGVGIFLITKFVKPHQPGKKKKKKEAVAEATAAPNAE